jgi:4-amino-4-deoxy-L-arabinose transferase-like glycosyltransferase
VVSSELAPATPSRRRLGLELALVVIVALAVLVPGISRYSLVDPWETHYGEVGRMMLQEHDWVHMDWPQDGEGFRSKPVLTFWMMAAGMRAVGLASDGGYSGEMEHDARTMVAIRLPFILFAVLGLTLMWWMLARLVSRRLAWLALLVVMSCPFFCLVARQGIPDMPLVACVMGALAMFTMAVEDGDRPVDTAFSIRLPGRRRFAVDHRHVLFAICGGFVVVQAIYYAIYFTVSPRLALARFPNPAIVLPGLMVLMLAALSAPGYKFARLVPFLIGSGLAFGFLPGRRLTTKAFDSWETFAPDRLIVRGIAFPFAWAFGYGWRETDGFADRLLTIKPITSMRQVYMLWCYAFLGLSVLAKGPPGLAVVGLVGVFHVMLFGRWRAFYDGFYEVKRGLIMMFVVFLPWHVAMWLKEGARFLDEYLVTHILNRAAVGVDNSPGTFEYYTSQLGHGMWLWAALLPAAIGGALLRARTDTRDGRVRFMIALWAICGVAFFSLVQTKFHHYILPAVPALAILVAFFLDDVWAGRARLHPLYAALGIGIVLLICRDLMWEPERWIEMFVFRYDRPWPSGEPWQIDPSDGFLALGVIAAVALAVAALPWRRAGVLALSAAGLTICIWSLQIYMPLAGTHWGMREAVREYYEQRTIYGQKLVYFGARELYDDWHDIGDRWTFETFVPDTLQIGQPMTLKVQINKPDAEQQMEQDVVLVGTATRIGDHDVEVTLAPGERHKLDPLIAKGKADPKRGRRPVRAVDADRLVAWQLYWRGENFWSGDEIYAWLPEMKSAFIKTDNVDFLKYLNDHTKSPLGRRTFVITEAGRATSVKGMVPTQRGRDTFEILDTTSNKFSIVAFYL